ncbi:MAG: NYN domain-containing protein [Clostridiales bacterium]
MRYSGNVGLVSNECIIIDGYNVIHAWNDLLDLENNTLEHCREKFLEIISSYQGYKKIKVIVVFDAYNIKSKKVSISKYDNIEVVFTKEEQKADNYIERMVADEEEHLKFKVVTSDYLEQTMVLRLGGVRVTPNELKNEIKELKKSAKNYSKETKLHSNTIMSNIDEDMMKKLDKYRKKDY